MKTNIYIYDLEVYRNFFCGIFHNYITGKRETFKIYQTADWGVKSINNSLLSLHSFLNKDSYFVGFNNDNYDNQILEYIYQYYTFLKGKSAEYICEDLHKLSNKIINEGYKDLKYSNNLKYFDLKKIGGGSGLLKSLKACACNLKCEKIQDLPILPNTTIRTPQIELLIKYCNNDVNITLRLFENLYHKVLLRINTWKKFKINVLNETDSGIANRLLEKLYTEKTNDNIKDTFKRRNKINRVLLSDIIPKSVYFSTDVLSSFLKKFKDTVVDCNAKKITINPSPIVTLDGTKYKLGAGGLHSVDKGFTIKSTDNMEILDCDVKSYYPNIMIKDKIKPEHLKVAFLEILEELTKHKIKAKEIKDNSTADIYKIVVNSIFGKLGSNENWIRDFKALLSVTIPGQLKLLMLVEWLVLNKFKVISANTDGLVTLVDTKRKHIYYEVCKAWEIMTKLDLAFSNYKLYVRRDVNNYLSITDENEIKTKGVFNPDLYKDVSKSYNYPIISKAVHDYFVYDVAVEDTIACEDDILNFCTAPRVDKKYDILYIKYTMGGHITETLQKTNRYFVSRNGGTICKYEPGKISNISLEKGRTVTLINDLDATKSFNEYKIDIFYYISAANKIIKTTKGSEQLTLM